VSKVERTKVADTPSGSGGTSAGTGAFAGLGLFSGLGAVAAKSCCVLPILLASSGLGGAWIGREIQAYRPYFLGVAWFALALAWVIAIRRKRAALCASNRDCRTTGTRWSGVGLLTASTLVVGLATVWDRIEPVLARFFLAIPS
jgi:mercuric ion transport protein